jgi:CBS domain-containing protein
MFSSPVRYVMDSRRLLLAAPDMTVFEAARKMSSKGTGAVLILQDQRLIGIFTERDAVYRVIAHGRDPAVTSLADVMTRSPKTIGPEKTFGYAMMVMHENGFRHLPVVEDGRPLGLLSARNALDPELEEFVSETQRRKSLMR